MLCHWSFGPGKYGPACTIIIIVERLHALTIKLTRASARTRVMSRARARECVYV